MNIFLRITTTAVLSIALLTTPVSALTDTSVTGASAVLIDQQTGQILYSKNGAQPMFPASTTKVLTALILLEDTPLTDVVTIDAETPFTEGSRIYLMEGEQVTVEQLLYAMLLESANDAAIALAKHHSGTVAAFSRVMNERAKSLGAKATHFTNPNGLPDPEHTISAEDMARIACKAMENPTFRKMVSTVSYDLGPTNRQPEVRHLYNGNRMLFGTGWRNKITINGQNLDIKWELADGIKTGYTVAARQCLVASASLEGRRVISVIFKSEGKEVYKDARVLLQAGLEEYVNLPVLQEGARVGELPLEGTEARVPLVAGKGLTMTVAKGTEATAIKPQLMLQPGLQLPIAAGQLVGVAVYRYPDGTVREVPLKAAEAVADRSLTGILKDAAARTGTVLLFLGKGAAAVLGVFLLWRTFITWQRLQKRKRLRLLKERAERHAASLNTHHDEDPFNGPRS